MNFSDVVNYDYSLSQYDADIRDVLLSGGWKPEFSEANKAFLPKEFENFLKYITTNEFDTVIRPASDLCDDKMRPDYKKAAKEMNNLNITNEEERSRFKKNILGDVLGTGFVSTYKTDNKNVVAYYYDNFKDPFTSVYTAMHEITHIMQKQKKYPTHLPYEENNITRAYKEIHANSTAGTFMLLKAYQTQDKEVIAKTEKLLKAESAGMQRAILDPSMGARYGDYGSISNIIDDFKKNDNWKSFFADDGNINWDKMFDYTSDKVFELGYTTELIEQSYSSISDTLRPISSDIAELGKIKDANPIFNDFYNSQVYLQEYKSQNPMSAEESRLRFFYQGVQSSRNRERAINSPANDGLPYISEYRNLYRLGKLKKPEKTTPSPSVPPLREAKGNF